MQIDEMLMHQLFQTTRIISYSLNRFFKPYNLHFSEWGIIIILMNSAPLTQRQLACYLKIEPASISKSLAGLEKKGLIIRETGTDRREKNVFLTEKSKNLYQQWNSIAEKHRKTILADLTLEKKQELHLQLKNIYQATQLYDEKSRI